MNPTVLKYVGIAVAILMVLGGVYMKGRHDIQVKFDAYKLEIASQAKAQEIHNQQVIEQRDLFNKGVVDGYKAKLAAANSYINSLHYNGSSSMPSSSNASAGVDGITANDIPSPSILASDCAATTVQLVQLQQWAKGQVEIK